MEEIVLGGGCFWCIEALFQRVRGVDEVVSGYAGGTSASPVYAEVSRGSTGYAEVVKVSFDTSIITLEEILDIFMHLHNPTTLNKQGADAGTQYRSAIYYTKPEQLEIIEKAINLAQSDWADPIVTEVKALEMFYRAEDYHQDYFNQHPGQGYCQVVINPKLQKLREKYFDYTK